jgi:hypothetical protein
MSTYIKLSTQEYPRHIGDIELDSAGMADYAIVEWVDPPAFDPQTQRRAQQAPQQQGDKWVMVWEVTQIPFAEMAAKVRTNRNQKLYQTDWTQLIDAPVDRQEWLVYRQELRDISSQTGFPWEVQWPAQPE